MSNSVLISISYCCTHHKGRDPNGSADIDGQRHAEWLEQAVDYYIGVANDLDYYSGIAARVIVACTGFPGMLNITNAPGYFERDVMWRIAQRASIIGVPQNPGHQVGAALCIRQGLETAGKWGYDLLIHTAEDVLPRKGVVVQMVEALSRDELLCEYVGEKWGERNDELNSQFFGCRTQSLVGPWDACQVTGAGHIERYLKMLLEGKICAFMTNHYRTTHDFDEWQRWRQEQLNG